MHINGIIITKQFISHRSFKRLRGSVGRAHIHFGYIFLKSNEKIVVKTPKSLFFYCFYSLLCDFTIYTYFTLVKVAKLCPVSS